MLLVVEEIDEFKSEFKEDFNVLREDFHNFKIDLFKWLLPLLIAQSGLIVALIKLL